jgi:hypothetical protein
MHRHPYSYTTFVPLHVAFSFIFYFSYFLVSLSFLSFPFPLSPSTEKKNYGRLSLSTVPPFSPSIHTIIVPLEKWAWRSLCCLSVLKEKDILISYE